MASKKLFNAFNLYRKPRNNLSILQELARITKQNTQQTSYQYMDDPYLTPIKSFDKRNFLLSRDSGKEAARYAFTKYPQYFSVTNAIPSCPDLNLPPKPTTVEDSIEGLQERIFMKEPLETYNSYNKILDSGKTIPINLTEDLLDLLAFYNSERPAKETSLEKEYFKQDNKTYSLFNKKSWKDSGPAEILFENIKNQSKKAVFTIIQGRARFLQAEGAFNEFKLLQSKNEFIDLRTYNAVLSIVAYLNFNIEEKCNLMLDILNDINKQKIHPDLVTLNHILWNLTKSQKNKFVLNYSLKVINEIKKCNIEPSLSSLYYLLEIFDKNNDSHSFILYDIIDYLSEKNLEIHSHSDYDFFHTAMNKCFYLKDLVLAYKIHAIIKSHSHINFHGNSMREGYYYNSFLTILSTFDSLDNTMKEYNSIVPHLYTPTIKVMEKILYAIDLNETYDYLPQIWTDMVNFNYFKIHNLLLLFFKTAVKVKENTKVELDLLKIIDNFIVLYENDKLQSRSFNRMELSGKLLDLIIITCLNLEDSEKALKLFKIFSELEQNNYIDDETLIDLLKFLISEKDLNKISRFSKYLKKSNYSYNEEFTLLINSEENLNKKEKEIILTMLS